MEIFEIAVRRQAKETQDAIELRARLTASDDVAASLSALDVIIYAQLAASTPATPPVANNVTLTVNVPSAGLPRNEVSALPFVQRETIVVGEPTEEEVQAALDATERAMQDLPPLPAKAKRKYTKRTQVDAVAVEVPFAELPSSAQDQMMADAEMARRAAAADTPVAPVAADYEIAPTADIYAEVAQEILATVPAPASSLPVVQTAHDEVTAVASDPVIDFDLLSMDEGPAPQPAVVNVAKLKVPEVKYEEPKVVASAANASAPEVTDPLKLQKRIQDAIASRVISPEPVLSLMHDRGFNSTRETDEACRIAILELIIAAEAKK